MNCIRWRIEEDIQGRFPVRGVIDLYAEADASGRVTREIGVNNVGAVLYVAPSSASPYRVFDCQVVQLTAREDDVSPEAFERLWLARNEE